MDLRRIRTFVAVVEEGSVSKAAQRLRTAQPALSRHIIDLESELGLKLFDRIGRRLVLTREGEQIVDHCRSVLGQVERIAEQAQFLQGGEGGLLKLAASPQIIESVLATLLPHYAAAYPRVEVKLREAVGRDQLTMLERGHIDIAVGLLEAVQSERRFATFELPSVELLAACAPSWQIGKGNTIEIAALAPHLLLLLDSSYAFRKAFDAACQIARFIPLVAIESRAPHTLLALAEAGHGVAIIQTAVPIKRYKVRILRITHRRKPIRLPMAAVWNRRRTLPLYGSKFCTLLAAHMRTIIPDARRPKMVQG